MSTRFKPSDEAIGYDLRIIGGNGNPKLCTDVAEELGTVLVDRVCSQFADGETNIAIKKNIRGSDVFLIQPTCSSVNDNLMELLLFIHTLKLSSAKRITAVIPYFGYARQDRKVKPRVPISASAVAQLIEAMGPHRVVTIDLHCGQIQGFFHATPVDNLFAEGEAIAYWKSKYAPDVLTKVSVVSPDAGGVLRARRVADALGASSVVTIMKRRVEANMVESMQIVGDVSGQLCFIVDDMIDTAGTLTKAAALLKENGAQEIHAWATHGVFSGEAMKRLNESVLNEVIVTDTIPQEENARKCPKLVVLSIAPLLAKAVMRIHKEESLSILFNE